MWGWTRPASFAASSYADGSSDGSPAGKRRKMDQDELLSYVVKGIIERFPYCDLAEGVMVSYHYRNITLVEPPRKLYTYRGKVSFETHQGSTPFHGHYLHLLGENFIVSKFTFHWRGDRRRTKTTAVKAYGENCYGKLVYKGQDSSKRSIEMVVDNSAVWCNTCECWHWETD